MMDEESKEVLLRVKENHVNLVKLCIGDDVNDDFREGFTFSSSKASDFTKLGQYIATNKHLTKLEINIQSIVNINIRKGFYDGLRRNSTIQKLLLRCTNTLGDVGNDILSAYRRNSAHLTQLEILQANLQHNNEADHVALTLRSCANLKQINLSQCNINCPKLLPIVDALRGQSSLEKLYLNENTFGNDGCPSLATLLSHPNCNLQEMQICDNNIGNEGAIIIVNSLANNTKLKNLWLTDNQIDRSIEEVFSNLLCNTTNINSIYSSNHTLCGLYFSRNDHIYDHITKGDELSQLLRINARKTNKRHVAMKKILRYNNLDMEPLYDWDTEDEYSLKAFPFVVDWFERAREVFRPPQTWVERTIEWSYPKEVVPEGRYNIDERKLSAIYQFARDMPLLFIPSSHINGSGRVLRRSKRKRVGS